MKPDAVLLDVRLPGLGGKEILEAIRAQNSTVPVILMTGYATVDDAMAAMWSGATDYVRKPLKADDVAGALDRALASRGSAQLPSNTVRTLAGSGTADALATPRLRPPAPPGDPLAWLRSELASRRLTGLDDTGDALPSLHEAVRLFESLYVDELMRRSAGNVARASRAAGVTRPNFHRKLRSLGLDAGRYRGGSH
jgi:DNA-binding NtrC family response regulator